MESENASSRRFFDTRDIDKCCTRDAHSVTSRISQVIRTKCSPTLSSKDKCPLEIKLMPTYKWSVTPFYLESDNELGRSCIILCVHKEQKRTMFQLGKSRKDDADFSKASLRENILEILNP